MCLLAEPVATDRPPKPLKLGDQGRARTPCLRRANLPRLGNRHQGQPVKLPNLFYPSLELPRDAVFPVKGVVPDNAPRVVSWPLQDRRMPRLLKGTVPDNARRGSPAPPGLLHAAPPVRNGLRQRAA